MCYHHLIDLGKIKKKKSKSSQQYVLIFFYYPILFCMYTLECIWIDETFNLIQNFNQFSIKSTKELKNKKKNYEMRIIFLLFSVKGQLWKITRDIYFVWIFFLLFWMRMQCFNNYKIALYLNYKHFYTISTLK